MIRSGFRPTVKLAALLAVFALLLTLFSSLHIVIPMFVTLIAGSILLLWCWLDWRKAIQPMPLTIVRELPAHLNLHQQVIFALIIENLTHRTIQLDIQERLPYHWQRELRLFKARLASKEKLKFEYQITPQRRGLTQFEGTDLRVLSPSGLWQIKWFCPAQMSVRVYPDFSRLLSSGLTSESQPMINGLKQFNKRGSGTEFDNLREYRYGDTPNRIDWGASGRRLKLITREYREEQSQQVIVMLDSGYRMNVETDIGSHFDAALSAILLLSHSVLKQGDWFSMQSFGADERWLANIKSVRDISRIMQHFYDLYPSDVAPDYLNAAMQLIAKKPKRALVLMVTTLQDEDFADLLPAVKLLQKHHQVALIHIENEAVNQALSAPVTDTEQAEQYFGAVQLSNEFRKNWQRLQHEGVLCIASKAKDLLPHSLNIYLKVKRSGML